MKSLRELPDEFHERQPELPPLPPVLPGEDPPPPTYDWVLPVLLGLAICLGFAGLLKFLLDQARGV